MSSVLSDLQQLVARFQADADASSERSLRQVRLDVAGMWAGADASQAETYARTDLRQSTQILRASGLANLEVLPEEEAASTTWRKTVEDQWPSPASVGSLLACSLFYPAHELPLRLTLDGVPPWVLGDYISFLLQAPELLLRSQEGHRYFRYLERLIGTFNHLFAGPLDATSLAIEEQVVTRLNVVQAYFHDDNVRDLMKSRGELIERFLRRRGFSLEHKFGAGAPDRWKHRIGILAQSYSAHTESYFALAHLEALDREIFEVFVYAFAENRNPIEELCRSHADEFVLLPRAVADQAARIRRDDLDVIVTLTNVAAVTNQMALLCSHRLARAQVASMSAPVTTGLGNNDYFLSAEFNESDDAAAHYTETLCRIPGSLNHYAFRDQTEVTDHPTRAALGVGDDDVVFFSAANYYKIVPELAALWADVLRAVPRGVLVLLPFNPNWNSRYPRDAFCRRLLRDMEAHGIAPDRIRVVDPLPTRSDVAAVLKLADVYLDGYPFSGACSMFDPIAVGCPVVVREGNMARSRHASAILRMMGLADLITRSDADYLRQAVALGQSAGLRAEVRGRILERLAKGNPVLDSADFGQRLNPVLQELAARHAPKPTDVKAARGDDLRRAVMARSRLLSARRITALTDIELVRSVLLPSFAAEAGAGHRHHMVDVGACYGQMAALFLRAGWTADLFEPDPACRAVIGQLLAPFVAQIRLHPLAVSDEARDAVSFYKADTNGLSGLGPSPYGRTKEVISVRAVRLAEHLTSQGTSRVDLLKVDTEGQDLKVLASHDFQALPPRFVLIEVNTVFPDQSTERIRESLTAMRASGYEALIFRYDDGGTFQKGIWDQYWLTEILFMEGLPRDGSPVFANVILYRRDDTVFLERLLTVLDLVTRRDVTAPALSVDRV